MEPYRRYCWMIELLSREKLTREEICDRWERSPLNDTHERLSRRTFIRDKQSIEDHFDLEIQYDPVYHTYSLMDTALLHSDSLLRYLLEQNRMTDLARLSKRMREKVVLEPLCTGSEQLPTLLEAMEAGVTVRFKYISYLNENEFPIAIICFIILNDRMTC